MRALVVAGCVLSLLCLPIFAFADWSDNFDSYTPGEIIGQGGWDGWNGDPGAGADVVDTYSFSDPYSVEIEGASDLIHEYDGYTSGRWFYVANMYIPDGWSAGANPSYFIMQSQYYPSTVIWAVQFGFANDGHIHCDCGSTTEVIGPEFVTGDWAEIRVFIDLDEDWLQIYYEGQLLDDPAVADHPTYGGGQPWTAGPFGQSTGPLDIASVDLFSYNNAAVYYDDISLSPAELWVDLKVNGGDAGVTVTLGDPLKMTYAVVAGDQTGMDGDVWVVLRSPLGGPLQYLSYDGDGPYMGWNPGYLSELSSGALGNYYGIPINFTPGVALLGSYTGFLAVDGVADGIPTFSSLQILDSVGFSIEN